MEFKFFRRSTFSTPKRGWFYCNSPNRRRLQAGRRGCGSISHSKSSSTAILYLFGATFNLWIWIIKFAHNGSAKSQANCCCSFFVAHELVWRYYWLVAEWFMDGIPNLTIISFSGLVHYSDDGQKPSSKRWVMEFGWSFHFVTFHEQDEEE